MSARTSGSSRKLRPGHDQAQSKVLRQVAEHQFLGLSRHGHLSNDQCVELILAAAGTALLLAARQQDRHDETVP
jgi:hypothetical protein